MKKLSESALTEVNKAVENVMSIIKTRFDTDEYGLQYLAEIALMDVMFRYYNAEYIDWEDLENEYIEMGEDRIIKFDAEEE